MREKEIAQAIMKLIQDWGESILNDELLFRVMLDDSLSDSEKKMFHCLNASTMNKLYQAYQYTKQNKKVSLSGVRICLEETTDMQEQWINSILSIFQTAFSESEYSNFDEAAIIKKEVKQEDKAKVVAKVTASNSGIIDNIQVSIGQKIEPGDTIAEFVVLIDNLKLKDQIEARYEGIVLSIEVEVGQKIEEGDTIAILDLEAVRQKAEQGAADAQYILGEKYYYEDNYKEAVKWLQLASEKNHDAEFLLGGCYYEGNGVERNTEQAYKLWKRSEKWNYKSQYWLGYLCYYRKDYEQAVYWLQEYFKSSSNVWFASWRDDAYLLLGECYYYGRGVAKDEEKAFDYWIKVHSKKAIDRLEKCFPIKYQEYQENMEKSHVTLDDLFPD